MISSHMNRIARFILFSILFASIFLVGCVPAPIEYTAMPRDTQPPFPADTATGEALAQNTQLLFPAATQALLQQASATSYPGPEFTPTSAATPYVPPEATSTSASTLTSTPAGAPTATGGVQPTAATATPTSGPSPTSAATSTVPGAVTTTPDPNLTRTPAITSTLELTTTATEYVSQPIGTPQTIPSVVSIWHGLTDVQRSALDRVIDSFQNNFPDVIFDVTYIPKDELRKRYEAASYYGGGPSLLIGPAEWGWAYARSDLVADLSPYASPEFLATINPPAVDTLILDGKLLGLPFAQQGYVMYRNASIVPQASGTLDALVVNAQNSLGIGNEGAYLERESLVSSAILSKLDGRMMDAQSRPAFNSDAGLAWLGLLARYADAGIAGMHTNRDLDLFEEGKIGVIIEGTWRMRALIDALGPENLVIDPWPTVEGGDLSGYVQTEAIYLNTNTPQEHQLAALRFMGYLFDQNVQSLLGESGWIPTVLQATPRDIHIQQAMIALQGGVAWPMADELVLQVYWNALDEAINDVFERGVSPQTALQSAHDVVNVRLDDLGGE